MVLSPLMNLRYIVLPILAISLLITLSQIGKVSAQMSLNSHPISSPITSPTPTPSPVTSFTKIIRGNIKYRFLRVPPNTVYPYIMDAKNVVVWAINSSTYQTTNVQTNREGEYRLKLVPGQYYLYAYDVKGNYFYALDRNVTILVKHLDVEGPDFYADINYPLYVSGYNQARGSKSDDPNYNWIYDANNNGKINKTDYELLSPVLLR